MMDVWMYIVDELLEYARIHHRCALELQQIENYKATTNGHIIMV